MEVRVSPALLEVGKRVTAHLKWNFMPNEITKTGPIQSIQAVGPAFLVKVEDTDFFATGLAESPGWFTDYDPPVLPAPLPGVQRAQTPPRREPEPEFKTGKTPQRLARSGSGKRTRKSRGLRRTNAVRKSTRRV